MGGPTSRSPRSRIKQGLLIAALVACLLSLNWNTSSSPSVATSLQTAQAVQDELRALEQRLAMHMSETRVFVRYVLHPDAAMSPRCHMSKLHALAMSSPNGREARLQSHCHLHDAVPVFPVPSFAVCRVGFSVVGFQLKLSVPTGSFSAPEGELVVELAIKSIAETSRPS